MSEILVNGRKVARQIEARTHLADFLRDELLLTATHLGCEQGVCGACTVLIDGEPVRACLTPAALCAGHHVQTLEGLDADPVIIALRDAFSAEHALQCGYCTPGMLATARDIVLRLPDADEARIRLELAGNLCRCTGYAGIVKAIGRVLEARIELIRPELRPVEPAVFAPPVPAHAAQPSPRPAVVPIGDDRKGKRLQQTLRIDLPADLVWEAIRDPALVASCVPGATLDRIEGEDIEGKVRAALGPIRVSFTGTAKLRFDAETRTGTIEGSGRDPASGTALSGDARFGVVPREGGAAEITLSIGYALRGPLAQFGRGPIVEVFAAGLVEQIARNLEARLRGDETPVRSAKPRAIGAALVFSVLRRMLRQMLGRGER